VFGNLQRHAQTRIVHTGLNWHRHRKRTNNRYSSLLRHKKYDFRTRDAMDQVFPADFRTV